eukprot:COSAG06_NODE_51601_length_311_cov_0.660377_1_plen_90_part_10
MYAKNSIRFKTSTTLTKPLVLLGHLVLPLLDLLRYLVHTLELVCLQRNNILHMRHIREQAQNRNAHIGEGGKDAWKATAGAIARTSLTAF